MRRVLKFMINLLLTAGLAVMSASCSKDEPEGRDIEVRDKASLTQDVFADQTQGKSNVTFTTTGAWTSLISENPSSTKASDSNATVAWISISPDHGDRAGDYTVAITLTPNLTGADRTAVITISCGGTGIAITVTQKAEKEDGTPNLSNACEIVSFSVDGEDWDIDGTDITHTCPVETEAINLVPTITLSPGARVNPLSGAAQNFFTEQGVIYTVTAEDGVTTKTYTVKATVQAVASGTTGECTWTLTGATGNYTLTISGNGAMDNYIVKNNNPVSYFLNTRPWTPYLDDIKTVVIQDGVSAIGGGAFTYCSNLTNVAIGNSVTIINHWAFNGCQNLTSATIPNLVTTIGDWAFNGCQNLTSVSIPNLVTTVGDMAFTGCRQLTSINVDLASVQYSSENGVLFNKAKTRLIAYPAGKTGGSYVVPNSVTTIESRAFEGCEGLTSVTIGNSVETIGTGALYWCSSLATVVSLNPVPPNFDDNDNDNFPGVFLGSITLKVPANAVDAYKAAPVWRWFKIMTNE